MKNILTTAFVAILYCTIQISVIKAQGECLLGGCPIASTQHPAGPALTTTSTAFIPISTTMKAGNFALCNVTTGIRYEWSLCSQDGGVAPYDAELTLFNATNNTELCYSDDYCFSDPKIEWIATFTGTVKIQINEHYCINNNDNTTLVWRMQPTSNYTDYGVENIYTMGTLAIPYLNPHSIQALVKNHGSQTVASLPVTLTISGANSFTNTQNLVNIPPGATGLVTFSGFSPSNSGNNHIQVSLPNDDNPGNNSLNMQQTTSATASNYAYGSIPDDGFGLQGYSGDLAARFTASSSVNLTGVKTHFKDPGGNYQVKVWSSDPTSGMPGTELYASQVLTPVVGINTVDFQNPVTVNGDFFIGVSEKPDPIGISLAVQTEAPVRDNIFYINFGGFGWDDFYPHLDYRIMIEAVYECTTPAPPVISFDGEKLTSSSATGNQWFLDGTAIPNATGNTHIPTQNGNYTVTVTIGAGCSSTSQPYNYMGVFVEIHDSGSEITIFPNPSRYKVNISVTGLRVKEKVIINNIIGVRVKEIPAEQFSSNSTLTFDASELGPGVYFATIKTDRKNYVRKFIIQN